MFRPCYTENIVCTDNIRLFTMAISAHITEVGGEPDLEEPVFHMAVRFGWGPNQYDFCFCVFLCTELFFCVFLCEKVKFLVFGEILDRGRVQS